MRFSHQAALLPPKILGMLTAIQSNACCSYQSEYCNVAEILMVASVAGRVGDVPVRKSFGSADEIRHRYRTAKWLLPTSLPCDE